MMQDEAICPVRRDRDGEWTGLCYQCREWEPLDSDLMMFGVCGECREALRDQIWDRNGLVLKEIMTKYQYCVPQTLIDEAADILEDMATVMGAHAAPDPRDNH